MLNAGNTTYGDEGKIVLRHDGNDIDVLSLKNPKDLMTIRGGAISMIFQHIYGKFACLALVHGRVQQELLDHLVADGDRRGEAGHGLLKDHGNRVAADGHHVPGVVDRQDIDVVLLQNVTKVDVLLNYQWYFIPATFFMALVLAFVFVGDGLRDAADPYSGH